jgi:glyoxylase-like metal-dependent hydrolase (beta-lactamase superfamily II)/rhodanese-related sulfurtransferase
MDHVQARERTGAELKALLDGDQELFIVDVRNRDDYARSRIEGRRPIPDVNVPYFEVLETGDSDDLAQIFADYAAQAWKDLLPRHGLILVVCAKGGTSAIAAEGLQRLGYNAVNLAGGMQAWGDFYDRKAVVQTEALSIYQVMRPARGDLSYILVSGQEALVVDPNRHIEQYGDFLTANQLSLVAVLDTHGHADHISGGRALADRTGSEYYLHPYDAIHPIDVLPATMDYEPLREGQEIRFGAARLTVLHIPGHTLGNLAFLVNDTYLLSGDSIFIQSIARPDLGGRGDTWAPLHYRSLARLTQLPDHVTVLPGHFSTAVEANAEGTYAATLGLLKRENDGLQMVARGEQAFVAYILASLPTFPPQYVDIKRVNAGLLHPDEEKASELELGRNVCALSQAYSNT